MLSRSTWLHLRIPFSVFLMPVYLFALSQAGEVAWWRAALVFVIVHLLLYPASNGYNSFYDKDEDSIGGLESPPPVKQELLYAALAFDAAAIALGLLISWQFALLLLGYGLVSKAYSHPAIRLKSHPWLGLLTVAVFQGAYSFWMCYTGLTERPWHWSQPGQELWAAVLSSLLLLGSYPMTQVYQHAEDARRGDKTVSLALGIRGTFIWTAAVFTAAMGGFFLFFSWYYAQSAFFIFQLLLLPVLLFFGWWTWQTWRNPAFANFRNTMRLNLLSSVCLILFFAYLCWRY